MSPLIAIAATLFPEIIKAIAGDRAGTVADRVTRAVTDSVKTKDPVHAQQQLTQNPQTAESLREKLAQIALEETKVRLDDEQRQREAALADLKIRAEFERQRRQTELDSRRVDGEDRSGARILQRDLSSGQSPVAWVAPALSMIVTVGFFVVLGLFIFNKNSLESTSLPVVPAGMGLANLTEAQFSTAAPIRSDFVLQIINICVGTLTAAFATVMSFWLGSSQGSRSKDELVAQIQTRQSAQASEVLDRATDVVVRRSSTVDLPPPSKPVIPEKEPDSEPAGDPVKPAAPGLLDELLPDLLKPHRHFPDGVSWALSPRGVSIDGAPAQGTPGKPTTVRTIWQRYGALCAAAAKQYGVPVELIVATIATESSGDSNARRPEPKINDESVGLMQTLVATARSATGRKNLRSDDLLDPRTSIEAGTAYIAQQRGSTWFDPPLVAAAYNAGSLRRDEADANRWKLVCHPRGTGKHIDKFVAWFSDCMVVAMEDGWATDPAVPSFASAMGGRSPNVGLAGSAPRSNLSPLVGTAERQRLFGTFTFVADPKPGNKENIRITNDWPEKNIAKVSIPVKSVLGRNGPLEFEFHKLAADQLIAMWLQWEKEGLLDRILTFDGSFVPRFIRGSTRTLSNHAFGTAFDINAQFNPLGREPAEIGAKGCVRELVPIASRFGFAWGGHFNKRPDGMHFEVARIIRPGEME
jgi:hypothetical protein